MMIIFFPITLVWTIIGTIWYSILSNMGALHCVKETDGSKPWLIIFWLAIMFFISLIFLLGVIASCLESLKHYLGADFFLSDGNYFTYFIYIVLNYFIIYYAILYCTISAIYISIRADGKFNIREQRSWFA